MQTIKTAELKADMVTAVPVITSYGQLVVDEHVRLTDSLIARIRFYDITEIQIQDIQTAAAVSEDGNFEPTYFQRIQDSSEFQWFQADYAKAITALQDAFSSILIQYETPDTDALYQIVAPLLTRVSTSFEMFDILHNMRSNDDSIYAHSMNVALIASMLGRWLKMSEKDLKILAAAALLHDIGKTRIPDEILNKPGRYSSEESSLARKHPAFGYLIFLSFHQLNPHIKNAALMHHERCDGSGYPQGLKGTETDDFAQIIAIADVYDAMTAARSYRAPLCPFQVIEDFENDGLQKYNPKFILTFLESIAYTHQNNRVILTDGREANIIMLNKQFLSKPIVQTDDGSCIDLSRTADLRIQSLL